MVPIPQRNDSNRREQAQLLSPPLRSAPGVRSGRLPPLPYPPLGPNKKLQVSCTHDDFGEWDPRYAEEESFSAGLGASLVGNAKSFVIEFRDMQAGLNGLA